VKQFESTITIVAKEQEVSATQTPKVLLLGLDKGESFTLKCVGDDAKEADEYLSAFFEKLMKDDKEVEKIEQESEEYEAQSIQGTTVSKGIGIGVVVSYFKEQYHSEEAVLSLDEALTQTAKDLDELYEENREKDEAEIFLAQKSLLDSELFQENFDNIIQEIEKLRGGKFESRIADYMDIQKRIESYMGINSKFTLPNGDEDACIVIADEELLPSEVEELSRLNVVGVILLQGSPTSHTSILLRAFNIPSIISTQKITLTGEYFYSILDASSGQLIFVPTDGDFEKAKEKQVKHKEQEEMSYKKRFEATETKSGHKIKVLANITNLASAKEAKELGAEGVGLLRTEFLFTQTKPTIEEQTKAYKEIFELFEEVTVRTLDIGGDKSLPYINIAKEDNPFLGVRGIRFSLQEQTLFKEQLQAILVGVTMSHNTTQPTIKIMFPMVSNTEEFIEAKRIALDIAKDKNISLKNIQFGIMLEVPSVIFGLEAFDKIVDFYSIGTNDLTQYLFAIERTHPTLSVDATSPMLMGALQQIKKSTQKPISICGEVAGLEEATPQLLEIGYDTLSISAKLIPSIKERIRKL
jgi:phosphoenolpyruvate-protein kinase (PTS system EI component)/phosphotransferase system HPr-like phosphotransfer protein